VKKMANKKLHPSIEEFKSFVKANPNIIKEVRSGNATWQEVYEDWYLLGEDDARWDRWKNNGSSNEKKNENEEEDSNSTKAVSMSSIMNSLKNMDQNQLQGYIANLNQALGTIQGVISQFSPGGSSTSANKGSQQKPTGPFSFRKD
jgi:hypothetical protein